MDRSTFRAPPHSQGTRTRSLMTSATFDKDSALWGSLFTNLAQILDRGTFFTSWTHQSWFQITNSRLGLGVWIYWSTMGFFVLLLLSKCLWIGLPHLSQASSRSSQSQQQAATWLRSPCLFTYSQQHNISSSVRCTLVARFFMADSTDSLLDKITKSFYRRWGDSKPIVSIYHSKADPTHLNQLTPPQLSRICHLLTSCSPNAASQLV